MNNGEDKLTFEEAIDKLFSPEFRNRLDAIVSFSNLLPEVMDKVVDKFVMELESQLTDRDVTITLTNKSRNWLARKGYDSKFGAITNGVKIFNKKNSMYRPKIIGGIEEKFFSQILREFFKSKR